MESFRMPRAGFGICLCLIALVGRVAAAKNGRDFAGYYRIQDATDAGAAVRLTLAVRVFNYTDGDINGATIWLEDSRSPSKAFGAFRDVSIPQHGNAFLKSEFTVSQHEYARWGKRGAPKLAIEFEDTDGKRLRRPVELIAKTAQEEE